MHSVLEGRLLALGLAVVVVLTTGSLITADFRAPAPGSDLVPVGGAEQVVHLTQGQTSIMWTSVTGRVRSYTVLGWPSQSGDAELGGGMLIERPDSGMAGVIAFGEKPQSIEFVLEG